MNKDSDDKRFCSQLCALAQIFPSQPSINIFGAQRRETWFQATIAIIAYEVPSSGTTAMLNQFSLICEKDMRASYRDVPL